MKGRHLVALAAVLAIVAVVVLVKTTPVPSRESEQQVVVAPPAAAAEEQRALDLLVEAAAAIPTPDPALPKMAAAIRAHGMWCGALTEFFNVKHKSSPNREVYHAHCSDGREAVSYELVFKRGGGFVSIEEK